MSLTRGFGAQAISHQIGSSPVTAAGAESRAAGSFACVTPGG